MDPTLPPHTASLPEVSPSSHCTLWAATAECDAMADLFAALTPRDDHLDSAHQGPPDDLSIDTMTAADVDVVAAIRDERDGSGHSGHAVWARSAMARRAHAPDDFEVIVARAADAAVGYACVWRIAPSETAPSHAVPDGLYLGGVVVRPSFRRLGIGRALTAWRMPWIFARSDAAYYFANSINRTSHDLHREFGFREIRRGIWAPGVRFTGGEGVLFRADRPED